MAFSWPSSWWPFGRKPTTPTAPPPSPTKPDPFALQILAAHNAQRATRGLPALSHDSTLQWMADRHALAMAATKVGDHDRAGDGSYPARLKGSGYTYSKAGENVAAGCPDIPSVMSGWMASPGHRANILGDFTQAGCQVSIASDGQAYWCAEFGRP